MNTIRTRPPASPASWPILLAALAYGLVEWLALARSRGADRLRTLTRR